MACLFLLALLFQSVPTAAQPKYPKPPPLLVITDLKTQSEASVAEAEAFSQFIRTEVTRSGLYRVINKQSMHAILKAHRFPMPCYELENFVAMGKLLGADQVLAGNVDRKGDKVELTLRLIDCDSAEFLVNLYREKSPCTEDQLLGPWGRAVIAELFSIPTERLATPTPVRPVEPKSTPTIPSSVLNRYPGMVYIPAGKFVLGSDKGDPIEAPRQIAHLPPYYIGKKEVTNWQYKDFVDAKGHRKPPHWQDGIIPPGTEDHPVVWISWEDAVAYTEWADCRLPTEREWEKAARGTDGRKFPWGDKFAPQKANTWETGIHGVAPAGAFPDGQSPYGLLDMAGNAAEWTADPFAPYPGADEAAPGYGDDLRVLRGGSWAFNDYYARTTHRYPRAPDERRSCYGFRIARDAVSADTPSDE